MGSEGCGCGEEEIVEVNVAFLGFSNDHGQGGEIAEHPHADFRGEGSPHQAAISTVAEVGCTVRTQWCDENVVWPFEGGEVCELKQSLFRILLCFTEVLP
jgi:hypothetical protein